ncbi:hypothetical protein E5L41_06095 [Helicobacter pylori]|nr:hypothetical protein E5L41_06095 [Helicobacter pylori]
MEEEFVLKLMGGISGDQIRDYLKICDRIRNQGSFHDAILSIRMHTLHFHLVGYSRFDFIPQDLKAYLIDTMRENGFECLGDFSFHQKGFDANNYHYLKKCFSDLMDSRKIRETNLSLSWQNKTY